MSKSKTRLNLPGINEVMKSPEIVAACEQAAREIGSASGIETETESGTINYIAYANVKPANAEAAKENFENNSLIKAITSAGYSLTKKGAG